MGEIKFPAKRRNRPPPVRTAEQRKRYIAADLSTYRIRKAVGLCPVDERKAAPGRTLCQGCLDKGKVVRDARAAKGLCPECGEPNPPTRRLNGGPAIVQHYSCASCRQARNAQKARKKAERKT